MKKLVFVFLVTVLATSVLQAQVPAQVIAVVNKADWCHVCQANGSKLMKEVMPVFENSAVAFVMNDLTNDNTMEKSKMELKEKDILKAVKKETATGLILIVNAGNGKLIEKISVAEPAEKIIMALKNAVSKENM
jgi:hypothetical protein